MPNTGRQHDRTFRAVAAVLVAVTLGLLVVSSQGFAALAAVRAYVGGESLWSKAQNHAVDGLLRYARDGDERVYGAALAELRVNLGDQRARLELDKPDPDPAVVRQGFLEGGLHPDDIDGMIRLYRRFRRAPQLARAIEFWRQGDEQIAALSAAAGRLHAAMQAQPRDARAVTLALADIEKVDRDVSEVEKGFSAALGDGSRWVRGVLDLTLGAIALLLVGGGLLVARAFFRRLALAEASLRDSERRFRALIEHSSDGISLLSDQAAPLFRSPAGNRMLGEPAPLRLLDVVHPDDAPAFAERWKEVLEKRGVPVSHTLRLRHADGSYRVVECVYVNRLDDAAVLGVVCNFRDVTDRKKLEAQLLANDRRISLGTLASGIAHEINNPLAYAMANLELVAERGGEDDLLVEAQEGLARVAKIVHGLKTFSRTGEERRGPVDVRTVLDSSIGLAGNELRHRARVVREFAAELPLVQADEAQLGQVFVNLLVNAAQAIQAGDVAQNAVHVRALSRAAQVIVEVQDTGQGIPAEHQEALFDPFFTTRAVGEGAGLGLFVCRNIVAAQGGTLSFESTPGQGSLFRVALPALESRPAPAAGTAAQALPRLRVLVIDDEPAVVTAVKRCLAAHAVTGVHSAAEALERLRNGEGFDAIVCDLMMPQQTGMDFYAALQRERPALLLRVLFLTGGAFTPAARAFLDSVPNERLEKPFNLNALRAAVARLPQRA